MMNKQYIEDLKFIRNELKFMINIHDDENMKVITSFGVSKFAKELRDWNFSDRTIFHQLKK
ncbi:MAG: hypothetical protein NTZ45_00155 [Methylococcales bacterium]|nr:hypothetical protein [Methylococcales bacterium]